MASFLIETYAPRLDERSLADVVARAAAAAESLRRRGTAVEHVRSYLVSADEMCLHVFEAQSEAVVRRAASLAGIEIDRVVETVGNETQKRRSAR